MQAASAAHASGSARSVNAAMPPPSARAFVHGDVVDEQGLLEALRAGHESAFETMVRLYGGRLLCVARRITKNELRT